MGNIEPIRKTDQSETNGNGGNEAVEAASRPAHEVFSESVSSLERGDKVAIFTQDNPDPDAIGSAFGLAWLIKKLSGASSVIYYGGEISHPQNRTMVNLLNIHMRRVSKERDYSEYKLRIFVDVASAGQKNLQDADLRPDIIIDHHEDNPEGDFLLKDIRVVGATATIVCDYVRQLGLELNPEIEDDANVATGLAFAIENDTANLVTENTRPLDIDCFTYLLPRVNINMLINIRDYPIPRYFFELEEIANKNKQIVGSVLVTGLEYLKADRRDSLPYIADKFLRMEGIETVVVFGIIEDYLVASLRTTNKSISLNSICHSIFGENFSGAKTRSGGARVPLGIIAPKNAESNVRTMVWEALKTKLTSEIFEKISGQ